MQAVVQVKLTQDWFDQLPLGIAEFPSSAPERPWPAHNLAELIAEFPENPLFASELVKLDVPPAAAIRPEK